ncbi:sulfatase [Reichenbachiella versicolor]|uniref:sulfatase n=1 Tax=Reichenbachiella versicolor TaxID=1821036 RepID=UPI000D6E4366|nr:sulfatase [Reichenbachiella versicolor]
MRELKLALILGVVLISCKPTKGIEEQNIKPNILFIAVDDMRPELGTYGSSVAVTPNIDQLAADGLQFNRAYCQQAICSPSRASLMTGSRPESINVIENYTYFRDLNPDIVTLPQHFQKFGYETVYSGKIYHGRFTDHPLSWSREPVKVNLFDPKKNPGAYASKKNQEIFKQNRKEVIAKYGVKGSYGLGLGPAYECEDVTDQAYEDGYNTDVAIATMKEMVANGKPFFLGLGFKQPHLNWTAPKKYWELYDRAKIPLTQQEFSPKNGAAMGLHASFELRVRDGIPKSGDIDSVLAKKLKHAYLSSVSYVDAQIGRMLEAIEEAGIRDNTIIILWSDHGWHLGDMGIWGKATNYEISTRVPLILSAPGMKSSLKGFKTDALVELVDMYPTLCELAGIPVPEHVEGQSFAPLVDDPSMPWKKAVFSQFPTPALREWAANPLSQGMRETYFGPLIEEVEEGIISQQKEKWDRDLFENHLMGYSMRTDQYRFISWQDRRNKDAIPVYVELYDHHIDPLETINIADQNPELVAKLLAQLKEGWKGNRAVLN